MKKYAFLLMGDYDTSKDHCVFKTDNMESYIYTVNNYSQAKRLVLKLYYDDFGAIETCGAFSEENINELMSMTNDDIPIARVVSGENIKEKMDMFFRS